MPVPIEDPKVLRKGNYGKIPMQAFSVIHDVQFLNSLISNPVES
jgi:hypothetical protein